MKKTTLPKNLEPNVDIGILNKYLTELNNLGKSLTSSDCVSLLQYAQDTYGFIPRNALEIISQKTRIPMSKVFGTASFYNAFSFTPKGKYTIKVCVGTACHVRGAEDVYRQFSNLLGIEEKGTSFDKNFTLERIACVGVCSAGPVVVIGPSCNRATTPLGKQIGLNDEFYGKVEAGKIEDIIKRYSQ